MRSLGQLLLGTALSWGFGLHVFTGSPIINAADFTATDTITVDGKTSFLFFLVIFCLSKVQSFRIDH